ncbi:glycosyltransferase family 2 protein [Shewanella sp. S23-S33]|uniref:glycosyltransferase family 2 protein n=1 Tax=Shewanella sp. S23-S33 TaxID=3342769 RepID=UPI00372D5DD6
MVKNEPLVSVIMPAYNVRKTIVRSIQSVISQTYSSWELIVVDDCSTDDTIELVRKIDDPRIRVIVLPENSGSPALPRNVGIDNSMGQYIAFLDSDDCWRVNKLNVQVNLMLESKSYFSCTGYSILSEGKVIKYLMPPLNVDYRMLLTNNTIGCLTAILHKDILGELRFPKCGHEDYALWLKILKKNNSVLGVQSDLAEYNLLPESVSSSKFRMIPFFWNIYRNQEGFTCTRSVVFCFKYFFNVVFFKYKKSQV